MLSKSQGITVKSATFRLLDINSQTVQLAETDVSSRTATVAIDFGAKGDGECDGLSDLVEREQGTFADNADSNSDAISNALELYGWLTSFSTPPCNVGTNLVRVFSNPLSRDSDNDGVSDDIEEAACGNPGSDFTVKAGLDQQVTCCNDSVTLPTFIRGNGKPNSELYLALVERT